MLNKILPLALLFLLLIGCKQKTKINMESYDDDRLTYFLNSANNDSLPPALRHEYNNNALKIISAKPNGPLNRKFHFKVAARFWNMNALEEYKSVTQKALLLSKAQYDSVSIAKSYKFLGDYYSKKYLDDLAYENYFLAEKIYISINDKINAAKTCLEKASLQFYSGDLLGAEKSAILALKYNMTARDKSVSYLSNISLGLVYCDLKEYDKALKYNHIALKFVDNYGERAKCLNNVGWVYQCSGNHLAAIKSFKVALNEKNLFYADAILFATLKDNLAFSEFSLSKFDNLPKSFFDAYKIKDSLNHFPGLVTSNLNLSEYYKFKNDRRQAIVYAKRAYDIAKEHNLKRETLSAIKKLSYLSPNKIAYSEEYNSINDSIQLAERKTADKFARIEFETDNLIQQKNQLKAESVRKDRKLISVAALFALALLLTIITYLLNSQRLKNRELKLIRQKHDANEEIYNLLLAQQSRLEEGKQQEKKRIAKELHDGVMGKLTSIRLNLFVLGKKQDPETIQKALAHIDEIREVEKEIHSIAYDLGTNGFDARVDFLSIVRNIFLAMENHSGTRFTLKSDDDIDWQSINGHVKMQLYRILQEALQNIVKYALASRVNVNIWKKTDLLFISVTDDGIGFDKKVANKGFGLENMKGRAKELGGKLKIQSETGKGTTLVIAVPLELE